MSPIRKKNLMLLKGVRFGGGADLQTWIFAAAGLSLMLIAAYTLFHYVEETEVAEREVEVEEQRIEQPRPLPRFAAIPEVSERKRAFFSFLQPYVDEANDQVLRDRGEILKLLSYFERNGDLRGQRLSAFRRLAVDYGMEAETAPGRHDFDELLRRADTIPTSLALAQAALESAWGTSRFALEGNNLFGMWCYEPGCGLVPRRRPVGKTYEVTAYDSPRDSFLAYMRNLNTSVHYADLREIRQIHRERGLEPTGYDLAAGLTLYSQERWTYVDKVRSVIAQNRLETL